MPYITKFNSRKIISLRALKEPVPLELGEEIDETCKELFSCSELLWLSCAKLLFSDFQLFIEKTYEKRKTYDTLDFVFESSHPSYHLNKDCKYLNAKFENYRIPQEIKALGKQAVINYREIFKAELNKNPRNIDNSIRQKFKISPFTTIDQIHIPNSGITEKQNHSNSQHTQIITQLIIKAQTIYRAKSISGRTIRGNGHLAHKNPFCPKKKPRAHKVIENWRQLKNQIKHEILEHFQIKFNPELDFNANLLDSLNLKKCSLCY
ncbi:hypothetical protein N5C93_29960 [Pseudomonas nitroreducens]|uniref:hypothetical protein n=1 Tax=Pseudomonas nitroreducens TaxID=46680 RepID=UPI001475E07E|nr:hypothetical protein [Pseudomonas nitroreducens]MDG9858157.1 hypothetical protein [Pseudomonas nitroreducens]MDH1077068.1 hypothetical protein [Pseudomonas nitroreducens]NMZ73236.1 hypothetical protein [Pseudomonas nitroreducens]